MVDLILYHRHLNLQRGSAGSPQASKSTKALASEASHTSYPNVKTCKSASDFKSKIEYQP
jgi:hypothetical protein